MAENAPVITMQPVLENQSSDGFALWPVADVTPFGFLALSGDLTPAEVGTAVLNIASCNDDDSAPDDLLADPLGSLLHGLLTTDAPFAAGGLRVVDGSTGSTFRPGCCAGLGERHEWYGIFDGTASPFFGHDPFPTAERHGDLVRLTVDAERDDSPVIELPVTRLRHLLAGAELDLADFLALAAEWAPHHLGDHGDAVIAALALALRPSSPSPDNA